MSKNIDEQVLQDLFAGIEAPSGLDRWRERIADVHAEHEPSGEVTELRPRMRKKRSVAVAAAVVGLVGLGGAVVTSRLLADGPPTDPSMIIDGPDRTKNPETTQGAALRQHHGDLRITTAGQEVTDLRVTGTVIVDAPDVTLRRVVVVAPSGKPALQQLAANLTVVDSNLGISDVWLSTGVLLRHNVMGRVRMSDGPIRSVTIQDSVLTQVNAPTGPGSAGIHVLNNRFRGGAPSTGWNTAGDDYQWSGNTFLDTGAPAAP